MTDTAPPPDNQPDQPNPVDLANALDDALDNAAAISDQLLQSLGAPEPDAPADEPPAASAGGMPPIPPGMRD